MRHGVLCAAELVQIVITFEDAGLWEGLTQLLLRNTLLVLLQIIRSLKEQVTFVVNLLVLVENERVVSRG